MGKLRTVKQADAPIKLVWADPASLEEHPDNWKVHTDFQTQVVGDLIDRHGWIKPLIYNTTTGRLLDGHDRRKIALATERAAVPVIVGTWPEESEPEILATLDPSGALAKGDPEALDKIMRSMPGTTEALSKLTARLAESEGVLDWLKRNQPKPAEPTFQADPDGNGQAAAAATPAANGAASASPAPAGAPVSHVRQVQLFLDMETFTEFRRLLDELAEYFETENDTDTVMAALRDAHSAITE